MIAAWCVTIAAFAIVLALEMAEGALLAGHASHEEAVAEGVRWVERERTHRALSMARVAVYLTVGAAATLATRIDAVGALEQVLMQLVIAFAIVSAAESAGRAVGQAHPAATLATLDPVVRVTRGLLAPALGLGAVLDRWLHVMAPASEPDSEDRETSEEQFREVVAAEAEISVREEALIHGVFSMGDTAVSEVMVPRVDIIGIDVTTPWSEVIDRVRSAEHARLPTYEDTLDNITGVLYAKDLLADVIADGAREGDWQRLIRKAAIIPTSKRIDTQLREFQASRTHIAIVVDEYGGTAGLVTIEDILEEIVGEIHDEYDTEEPEIRQEGGTRFWVAGHVSVHDLAERLGVDFDVPDVTTVGGLVYELFNRVPAAGESVIRDGYRIVVEAVSRRRIQRVYFERLAPVPGRSAE